MRKDHLINKNHIILYKEECGCVDCKLKFPHYILEFDHTTPRLGKTGTLASMSSKVSLKKLKDMISECDVVCANCHRTREYKRRNGSLAEK